MLNASSLLSFHYCHLTESVRSTAIFTTICASCILLTYMMYDPERKKKGADKRGSDKSYSLTGNVSHLTIPPNEVTSWLDVMKGKWYDVVKLGAYGNRSALVNSYDIAMQLLSRETFVQKSKESEPLRKIGGNSLAGLSPELHTLRRKMLEPGFNGQVVKNSLEIICRHSRKLRDSLLMYADNGENFDLMDHASLCAYKIACETALGHEFIQDMWDPLYKEQMEALHTLRVHLVNRSAHPWLKYDCIFSRTINGRKVEQQVQTFNTFMEKQIYLRRQHREYLKANRFYDENTTMKTEVVQECYADYLLELEDNGELTKDEVLHNLNVYIAAGYDTIGTSLSLILNLLATHSEIQEKCVQEIAQVLNENSPISEEPRPGSSSSMSPPVPPPPSFDTFPAIFSLMFATSDLRITNEQLEQMKYLNCCIKEALRLYPILPILLRRSEENIELNDGRIIPANTDVPINIFSVHRDPKHFPDPEKFKPERHYCTHHSNDSLEGMSPPCMMSFGAGPRTCPGMKFAMTELKVLLAHLLLTFKWKSEKEVEKKNDNDDGEEKCLLDGTIIVPANWDNGFCVKITRRILG